MLGMKKGSKSGYYIGAGVIAGSVLLIWIIAFSPFSVLPGTTTTDADDQALSTFTLLDYRTGEDVSEWVEVSVWTEDPDDLPFDQDDDPYRLANFDEDVSSKDASDADIDLRDFAHAWLEIDPDFESDYGGYNGVVAFSDIIVSNDFRKLSPGVNYDYIVYVYHEPSNVSINVFERTNNLFFDLDTSDEWGQTTGNALGFPYYNNTDTGRFVVALNVPYNSTHGHHAGVVGGDEWDIDRDELDDMTRDELFWLADQSNFRTVASYYDMQDDTLKDYSSYEKLEMLTNAFTVRFRFNATVSLVAGNANQVNMTLSDRDGIKVPAELVVSGTDIYAIFYEPITFTNHMYNFDIDIFTIGASINVTYVQTGRVVVPQGDSPFSLGAFTPYNTAPIFDELHLLVAGWLPNNHHWFRPPTS
ncbi:hypothetical protein LCGC14_1319600 [marine sediment metagenome]|uniref:Uncharacterized protein n=1 Tax=marine sediment metagenome TaxID=412755 RepID=A0A0F9NM83_9ZZZZ